MCPMGQNWVKEIMKKKIWITASSALAILLLIIVACTKEPDPSPSGGGGSSSGSAPSAPTGVSATVSSSSIYVSWNRVSNASYYEIYYSDASNGSYEYIDDIWETETYISSSDGNLPEGDYYFKIKAVNDYGSSPFSSYAYCHYSYGGGGGGGGSAPYAPTGVSAEVSGSRVCVTWNSVSNASYYKVYRASSSSGSYSTIESFTSNTYYYDASPNTYNYYKVTAVNSNGTESAKSDYAYCYYSSGGGGGGTTVPDAPTGVTAENTGPVQYPSICISWNSVSNATSYKVYRSTSANGSYSQIGSETSYTTLYDNDPRQGKNYYKVKAFNSAGGSSYSSYAMYNYDPSSQLAPCPVHYTSHTASSNTITLRWTNPTSSGCGTPTTAYLKVKNPDTDEYVVLETMPGSDTWTYFNYLQWIDVFQGQRWVYCGIITENSAGISGGIALAYNVDTNTWYGGNGLELTDDMETEADKIAYQLLNKTHNKLTK